MSQLKAVDSDLKVDVFSEEGRSTVHVEVGEIIGRERTRLFNLHKTRF